jgi:glutamate 5-kinase
MKRIVVKLGTGVLSQNEGSALEIPQFEILADGLAGLVRSGVSCIVVSSGAIAAGVSILGLQERPTDTAGKQACAAVGQPRLIQSFDASLQKHSLHAAQLLLTHGDIDSSMRRHNAQNTLERLLSVRNIIPIINENDSVAVEELRFGDNDRLSAEVAVMVGADLLCILTSVDGFLFGETLQTEITNIEEARGHVTGDTGRMSVGGMGTKLDAVRIAHAGGIPVFLGNGRNADILVSLLSGKAPGTHFPLPRTSKVEKDHTIV